VLRRLWLLRRHRDDRCNDRFVGGPAGQRVHPRTQALRAGDAVSTNELGVVEENGVRRDGSEEGVDHLVALGRALSDPIRVRMLSMMAEGRSCCDFSDSGVPADEGEEGICVCEFEEVFSMGQSKVSYHMKKLKDAGLVREDRRGKWSFYTLDREATGELLGEVADRLLSAPERRSVVSGGC
jgi:ArsR family transcriptional regulator, arsenate/arsenite/antimonite-responsive transcriptional repressor